MAEYYLISQLPSLDGLAENMPLPISKETFLGLCENALNEKTFEELKNSSVNTPKDYSVSSSSVLNGWNEAEKALRLTLASVRASKMKISFSAENAQATQIDKKIMQVASAAAEMESPMEAEKLLNNYRLEFLETLRPMDSFSEEYLFYYSLKLDLLSRIRKFDEQEGRNSYKNIYNSIMNAEKREETL